MRVSIFAFLFYVATLAHAGSNRTFYLDSNGDDTHNGFSKSQAWRSLARLNSEALQAGDTVYLGSGETFVGSLVIRGHSDNPRLPITIKSLGKPATIVSPERPGITISANGIHVSNLEVDGEATVKKAEHNGIVLLANGTQPISDVLLDHVSVRKFGADGVSIEASKGNRNGFSGLRLLSVRSDDNFGAGITSNDDFGWKGETCAHRHLLISDCVAERNLGGSGIVLGGVRDSVVQYCRARDNRGGGGGVGIWAWACQSVVFSHCISSGTRSAGGDGGGFDLDGATEDCRVEECLSYDNDGPGYMHCDYPTAPFTRRNVIQNSVSIDDGAKEKGDSVGFGFVTWGSGLDNCVIKDNLTFLTRSDPKNRNFGALFVALIKGSQGPKDLLHVRDCLVEGNTVDLLASGTAFVRSDQASSREFSIKFSGNTFAAPGPTPFVIAGKSIPTLSEWQALLAPGSRGNQIRHDLSEDEALSKFRKVTPRSLDQLFKSRRY